MRFLLKLLFAPVVAVLAVFVWLCGGILYCASWVFGLASALVSILGVAVLVTYSVKNGIILLIIAFLVSPLGIPTLATRLLALLQSLRGFIQNRVYTKMDRVIGTRSIRAYNLAHKGKGTDVSFS